jgi:hypothetical protein
VNVSHLPPYPGHGENLPPLPTEPVDGAYLCRRYRVSKAQFHNRKNALPSVSGEKVGRKVLFKPEEVYLFDAADWYLEQGYTLDEVREAQRTFESAGVVPDSEGAAPDANSEVAALSLSPSADKFARDLAVLVAKTVEQLAPQPQTDPLRTLRLLDEAAEKTFTLTTRVLADVLGFSPQTLHKFEPVEHRHGFELKKVAAGKWRVRRLTEEEEAQDLAA